MRKASKSPVVLSYQSSEKTNRRTKKCLIGLISSPANNLTILTKTASYSSDHSVFYAKKNTPPFGGVFFHLCSYRGSYLLSPICVKYHRRYSISLP